MTMPEWVHHLSAWTDRHAGLGGWVGAIGALLAILAAWIIARQEYNRAKRQVRERRREEIDLITKIVTDFEAQMQQYKALGLNSKEAAEFDIVHTNDPEAHGMSDLALMPVMQWPTVEMYAEFKRYWFASLTFRKMAATTNANKRELYEEWQKRQDEYLKRLMQSIGRARRNSG